MTKVIMRIGTHAEKDYFEKLGRFSDGLMVSSNLMEATPSATTSLIFRLTNAMRRPDAGYYIDPMTYAFGPSMDSSTRQPLSDLRWLMSERRRRNAEPVLEFKRSYRELANQFGPLIQRAMSSIETARAISIEDLADTHLTTEFVHRVLDYQRLRLRTEFAKDEEYAEFADRMPAPKALFAPYFYIDPNVSSIDLNHNITLAKIARRHVTDVPLHLILCASERLLEDTAFRDNCVREISGLGIDGVWLWFSRLNEFTAPTSQLLALRDLVFRLGEHTSVYNLHGGFFSLLLSHFGLAGISHGVGYGEQKDVVPVIGQATPVVRYYLPAIKKRVGVLQLDISMQDLGIRSPTDFHTYVCDCAVCNGVVVQSARDISAYGSTNIIGGDDDRQSSAQAKRCRMHFLLNRFVERDRINTATRVQILNELREAHAFWSAGQLILRDCTHIPRWLESA